MECKRAVETVVEKMNRQEQNRMHMANQRALESLSETICRRERSKILVAKKRALESPSETICRQEQNRTLMAEKRALENTTDTECRREQNRVHMAKRRALESPSDTMCRQQQNRVHIAKKRALESPVQTLHRQEQNRTGMAKKRSKNICVDDAITTFLLKAKMGPNYVCTCCHRMMYKQNVVPCNNSKYTKASQELIDQVFCAEHNYISNDGNLWLCSACHYTLSRGKMPVQAKANNLQLDEVPVELSTLNALELRLISLRVPFLKMVALPSGKQRSIQGPAVNVPSKLDSLCTMLPRLPTESELIPLKFKRKLKYKGHYMYDYVSPKKLINALRWLKANNPLYADIEINDNWVEEALANDCNLFCGLVRQPECGTRQVPQDPAQCDSTNHNYTVEFEPSLTTATTNNKPCEWNSELGCAINSLTALARQNGFTIHDVPEDGSCLFHAIAYQLESLSASEMRETIANHLDNNSAFYCKFLAQPVAYENAYNADTETPTDEDAYIDTVHNPEQQMHLRWKKYMYRFRNGAWGDHITVQAISNVAINVLSSQHSNIVHVVPRDDNIEHEVYIGLILQYHYVGLDKLAVPKQ